VIRYKSWDGAFFTFVVAAATAVLLLIPLRNARSFVQFDDEEEEYVDVAPA
jgi:type IV secretory pathway component VirB8